MMNCLVCDSKLMVKSSWRRFLLGEQHALLCVKCESQLEYSSQPYAIYLYNAMMKEMLQRYKFNKDIRFAQFFARALKKKIRGASYDLILPIPMHPLMKEKRTFCHMEEVFREANIPFTQILEKTTIEQQSKKSKRQREKSAALFRPKENINIAGKRVLLVDDIWTTGTTMRHAEDVLLSIGAQNIQKIVLISGNK